MRGVTLAAASTSGAGAWNAVVALLRRNARAIRDALIIAGLVRAFVYFFVQGIQPWTFPGVDARAYWRIDLAHPYTDSVLGAISNYFYSPAFAHAVAPLSLLPFEAYFALWTAVSVGLLVWLVRPWPWIALILLLPIVYELCVGNIHFLLAAMIVAGFRVPGAWAFGILTKVTPGVGLLWFVVRRDLRPLVIALAVTAAITLVSFALAPSAWFEWVGFMTANAGGGELVVPRLIVGAGVVALAAMLDRRALVPVGVWIALPVVYINSWVLLLATVRLAADDATRLREPLVRGRA